ncbi:ArsR/SmtB family transcription factor [Lysobacter gummosus]|uniref:Helix-turn-helix domain-containing protein n=1 Tax=Lysobacter gummosus TaxID=262324 RepID=A0ABY3XH85_9GAMM|nr:helix-turn-helix domain-containing protein [Lysobacter gummosus]ALN90448.1 bacterial regulatory, arsR family protein [Lysobacter gummosus]UNP30968.1 helix-turn-helix domain-containing protein [Lysobacter gummosus]
MRPLHHPATDDIELTTVLYALADPVRLGLVRGLSKDQPVSCIGACIDEELPRATLSRHFDVLRSAGLVHTVKSGTQNLNTLRCDDLERRFPGLLSAILHCAGSVPAAKYPGKTPAAPAKSAVKAAAKPAARARRGEPASARAGKTRA